jgi:uncharacterized LabA/DUF88 family protein
VPQIAADRPPLKEVAVDRLIVYIDGFNLYNGLDEIGWRHYLWLDIGAFGRALADEGEEVVAVKYFTARVGRPEGSVRRQGTFLDAIQARDPELTIVPGNCIYNEESCHGCGRTWLRREEKKTDVSIAMHMMCDAYEGNFDTAVLVSGDTDLVPVVEWIQNRRNHQRVVNAAPPKRISGDLRRAADRQFKIPEATFRDYQMPTLVPTSAVTLCQPAEWCADPSAPLTL